MTKEEFEGTLEEIDPRRLIGKSSEEVENFFLVLALIYNDLKDLITFSITFHDFYAKPKNTIPSVHLGNYSGVEIYLYRMMSGLIHEFFRFLKENSQIYEMEAYKQALKKMPAPAKVRWNELISVAMGRHEAKKASELAKLMEIVRNNISFHYYQSGKVLRKGFSNAFHTEKPRQEHQRAYFALGENMRKTRFFYADAAVQEYMRRQESVSRAAGSGMNLNEFVDLTVRNMNPVLRLILESYIRTRPRAD